MTLNAITAQAVTRARVEHSLGARATLAGRTASATDPASGTRFYHVPARDQTHHYEVTVTGTSNGVTIFCGCPAGQHARPCWHVGLVTLAMEEGQG